MADSGSDDEFTFYGTPIEEEEESKAGQHRKDVKDQAATRALPIWKQEVTDEQGRRRFHGAFTGGYSAGYYNTVGSAEGWAPGAFRSSRAQRAGAAQQTVEQFLDEDELEELRRTNLQTTEQYDTFGGTAAELARRAAADASRSRPSAIPGLLPDELVAPVADSVGVRLLQRMGWRQGKGVGVAGADAAAAEEDDGGSGESGGGAARAGRAGRRSRWSQHAGVGPENTPLYLVQPKSDLYGLGFDPFKGAEEFRKVRQERLTAGPGRQQPQPGAKRQRGVAFGTGVLDEDDALGIMEDYVTHDDVHSYSETVDEEGMPLPRGPKVARKGLGDRLRQRGYTFEIQEEEEEEEPGGARPRHKRQQQQQQYLLPSTAAAPLALQSKEHLVKPGGFIPGFVQAAAPPAQPPYFPPPYFPPGWSPLRPAAAQQQQQRATPSAGPPPTEAQPPADPALRHEIDTLAFYVAKNGPAFEAMARQRAQREGAGRHAFLSGGEGQAYYRWKVHSFRSLIQPQPAIGQRSAPLSYEERGAMLGETPLPAQQAQQAAGGTQQQGGGGPGQTLARSLLAVAEADRQRIQAMLGRSFVSAQSQDMLQPAPEAAVGGLRKPAPAPPPAPLPVVEDRGGAAAAVGVPLPGLGPGAATAARAAGAARAAPRVVTAADLSRPAAEAAAASGAGGVPRLPVRTSEEWRPAPLLCKRLNVPDPYHGRPAELQISRFKTDHLALPDTAAAMARAVPAGAEQLLLPPSVQAAIEAAKQAVQQQAAALGAAAAVQQAQQQPEDAAGLADQFLSSLAADLMAPPAAAAAAPAAEQPPLPPGPPPPLPPEAGLAAEAAAAVAERPIDLFKAIFEDSDEEREEEAGGGGQEAVAVKQLPGEERAQQPQQPQQPPGQQQDGGAAAGSGNAAAAREPPPRPTYVPPQQRQQAQQQEQNVFGFAKLRREGAPAPPPPTSDEPAEGRGREAAAAGGGRDGAGAAEGTAAPAAAAGIDAETKRRVEEALRALKRQGKEKRESKEKKRGRKEKSKKKERHRERKEEKKSRHRKSKKRRREEGAGSRRRRGSGSGSDSSSDDSASE